MFEVFGEFDSVEELNMAAAGLKEEGDVTNLKLLAGENGIDVEFAQMYVDGVMDRLCDVADAALGKLEIESQELKPTEIIADWVEYIKGCCVEDEELARGVRRKGKTLKGCIAELLKWSFQNCYKVDEDIVKAAGVKNAKVELGIPGMGRAKKMIREYYMEK